MKKIDLIAEFGKTEQDTGSSCVQVGILTRRIKDLAGYLQIHRKDFHSRRGLVAMTNCRNKWLSSMKSHNPDGYKEIIQKLNLWK
jgi:small subunit ribosomal protein S15